MGRKPNSLNEIDAPKLVPAKRGSKRGWLTVSGQLPPDLADRFVALEIARRMHRTDLVATLIRIGLEVEKAA